jgi:hypothetical protein
MLTSVKGLLGMAILSGGLAAGFYYWWGLATVRTFAKCVGGAPATGVDCAHNAQMYGAILFSAIAVSLVAFAIARVLRLRNRRAA